MTSVPADVVEKLAAYWHHLGTWNPAAAAITALSVLTVVLWPRVSHRLPGPLVAIVVCTIVVAAFGVPVETIAGRFGEVPSRLPSPALPAFDLARASELFPAAFTIALLAAIESLLSAMVADGMIGSRHRSNMELVAQGVANLASPLFGGIPATGAIARTATNVKNGGRTPIAGIVHALTLLLIMLLFGRWAGLIPIPALAGILLVVAYHMSEWRVFVAMFRSPRSDIGVMVTTFGLTVLVDLTVALEAGMVLAAFLFMGRMAALSGAGYVTRMLGGEETHDPNALASRQVPDGVEVFEVYGTFFFGAASKFKDAIGTIEKTPRVLILRMREVIAIDATAMRALEDLHAKSRRDGTVLILSGAHAQPLVALERSGLLERIGEDTPSATSTPRSPAPASSSGRPRSRAPGPSSPAWRANAITEPMVALSLLLVGSRR